MDKKEGVEHSELRERDERSVFAYGIPTNASEETLLNYFSQAGKVRDVKLIMDDKSGTSKLVGQIEFDDGVCAARASALSGLPFLGKPLLVIPKPKPKPKPSENILVQSNTTKRACCDSDTTSQTVVVKNMPKHMTENDLGLLFDRFGPAKRVLLQDDGSAYVQFYIVGDAQQAPLLNQQVFIDGRIIEVYSAPELQDVDDDDADGP